MPIESQHPSFRGGLFSAISLVFCFEKRARYTRGNGTYPSEYIPLPTSIPPFSRFQDIDGLMIFQRNPSAAFSQ